MACSLFRRRKFEECIKICTTLLEKNEFDQVTSKTVRKKEIKN